MPSPFPGMDPFLEGWEWESFHAYFVANLSDALSPLVGPQYVVRMQRRDYVQEPGAHSTSPPAGRGRPLRELHHESFARILTPRSREVITVVELLSPANKCEGTGRRKYLEARARLLKSPANLVELDLFRGGRRLPMRETLPPGDYYAVVSRAATRPRAEVYAWTMRQRLPSIPIPLRANEPDVLLELQPEFDRRYDRAGYQNTLDYTAEICPPLSGADAAWTAELLKPFRNA